MGSAALATPRGDDAGDADSEEDDADDAEDDHGAMLFEPRRRRTPKVRTEDGVNASCGGDQSSVL
jgi:hypothetical protein